MNTQPDYVTLENLKAAIHGVLWDKELKLTDIHTHLFTPSAEGLWLSGIVELLRYHYAYREHLGWRREISPETFWQLERKTAAWQVWNTFFARREHKSIKVLPVSEGMRAILTILKAFDLDPNDLPGAIKFFESRNPLEHTDRVLELAGISNVIGTNNPFDQTELDFYRSSPEWHPNFSSALRLDDLVLKPELAFKHMRDNGFPCTSDFSKGSIKCARKFVESWLDGKLLPRVSYVGISFPPDFPWTESHDPSVKVLEKIIIPVCAEKSVSLFLMPEPVRGLEPSMKNAGDFLGKMDSVAFARFAQSHPEVDLWVSPLNFSSQFEMSALSCNLPHVNPWSTWWYNHQPGLTQQLTNMRIEMHGSNSFLFNSDARVLEHLISKWWHFKQEFKDILFTQLSRLIELDYKLTKEDIKMWVQTLFDSRRLSRKDWNQVLKSEYCH